MNRTTVSPRGLRTALLLLCVLPAGCVTASAFPLGEEEYGPRPVAHRIILYDTVEDVGRRFVKVARVHGAGSSEVSWDRILEEMKRKARQVGADAMILGRRGAAVRGGDEDGISCERTLVALGIRFVE